MLQINYFARHGMSEATAPTGTICRAGRVSRALVSRFRRCCEQHSAGVGPYKFSRAIRRNVPDHPSSPHPPRRPVQTSGRASARLQPLSTRSAARDGGYTRRRGARPLFLLILHLRSVYHAVAPSLAHFATAKWPDPEHSDTGDIMPGARSRRGPGFASSSHVHTYAR
jgi:hypothetical protein